MFIVGIDIAKRAHVVSVMTSEGQTVCKPFSIRNNCSGYNLLLERLRRISNVKSEFTVAMESTAHYWLPLYTRLRREGWKVLVMNPLQTHAVRELLIRETKTDAVDAQLIADVVRFGRVRSSNVPQEELLALRELCRNRFYLIDLASDLKRKVTALLDQNDDPEALLRTVLSDFELEILETCPVEYRCYCSRERMERALISMGPAELKSLIDDQGEAELTCRFCDNVQHFTREQLEAMLAGMRKK